MIEKVNVMDDLVAEVVRRHLNVSTAVAQFRARGILELAFENEPDLFDVKRDLENLENLSRALGQVIVSLEPGSMTQAARGELEATALQRIHDRFLSKGIDYWNLDRTPGGLTGEAALACLRDLAALVEMADSVRRAIRLTKRVVENSDNARPSLARHNTRGIQLVIAARRTWAADAGQSPPEGNDLNEAGPFGSFLADLFDACGIEGNPRAAFRAWARSGKQS